MKCECGKELEWKRSYRTTPDFPYYLREYKCEKCGYMIFDSNRKFKRMGRIDDNGDDSHITGGRWV